MNLKERKELAARMPWVTRLKEPTPRCDGVRWWNLATRDRRLARGPAEELPERAHCRLRGWWAFKAMKTSSGKDGVYCWHHLMQQLFIDDYSEERGEAWRTRRWLNRNAPKIT